MPAGFVEVSPRERFKGGRQLSDCAAHLALSIAYSAHAARFEVLAVEFECVKHAPRHARLVSELGRAICDYRRWPSPEAPARLRWCSSRDARLC